MIGTLPGPINLIFLTVILVTWATTYASDHKQLRVGGAALFLSWLGASISTFVDQIWIHAVVMGLCAVLCLWGKHRILTLVGGVYAFRILFVGMEINEWISTSLLWAWTEVPLTAQILLILGAGLYNGGFGRICGLWGNAGKRDGVSASALFRFPPKRH